MHDFNHETTASNIRGASGNGSETERAIRLAAGGWDCGCGGLFDRNADWNRWIRDIFELTVGPHFAAVFTHAGQMQIREVAALDTSGDLRGNASSRHAGSRLLNSLVTTQSSRLSGKLIKLCPAPHLATATAIQAVEYNLPLRQALLGYLFFEWVGANAGGSIECFLNEECELTKSIGKVIARSFEESHNAFTA